LVLFENGKLNGIDEITIMDGLVFLAGILAVVAGLLQIFYPDMAWKSTEWNNRNRGIESHRTKNWRRASIVRGSLAVIGGILVICMGLFMQP